MHDSYVVVSLLKAVPIVLTVKILVIFEVAKGLAPQASVWCGGECPHAYPLKPLGGVSTTVSTIFFPCKLRSPSPKPLFCRNTLKQNGHQSPCFIICANLRYLCPVSMLGPCCVRAVSVLSVLSVLSVFDKRVGPTQPK